MFNLKGVSMELDDVIKEISLEASAKSELPLWVCYGGNWYETNSTTGYSDNFLYMNRAICPTFDPYLLRWYDTGSFEDLWVLIDKTWVGYFTTEHSRKLRPQNYVYLYSTEQPVYHPLQTKIANMLLGNTEPTKETKPDSEDKPQVTEAKPHVHSELIQKWIQDTNQQVWKWNNQSDKWDEIFSSWAWDEHSLYAVGDKPTEPPIKKIKFPWGTIEFYAPKEIEDEVNCYDSTLANTYGVLAQGCFEFNDEGHQKLFKRAYQEFQVNLNKFFKGELV